MAAKSRRGVAPHWSDRDANGFRLAQVVQKFCNKAGVSVFLISVSEEFTESYARFGYRGVPCNIIRITNIESVSDSVND